MDSLRTITDYIQLFYTCISQCHILAMWHHACNDVYICLSLIASILVTMSIENSVLCGKTIRTRCEHVEQIQSAKNKLRTLF